MKKMTVLLENSLNFHLVTSLDTLSNQNLKKIDFSAKFFQWKLQFDLPDFCWTYFDLFSVVFRIFFPKIFAASQCLRLQKLSAQKSDANFAGAKLKNFVAKRQQRSKRAKFSRNVKFDVTIGQFLGENDIPFKNRKNMVENHTSIYILQHMHSHSDFRFKFLAVRLISYLC
jgi:hypothetical protein